jgi:hypothetical protein
VKESSIPLFSTKSSCETSFTKTPWKYSPNKF